MITMDVETRATKMVTDVGLYAHAPTAKLLGMRYRLEPSAPLMEWRGYFADGLDPDLSDAPPTDLIKAVEAGARIMAHNAAYERVVLSHVPWWPQPPVEAWVCSAAWAASFNLPRGLGPLSARLLGQDQAKLVEVSRGVSYMWDAARPMTRPEDMDTQMEYCGRDVEAMEGCMALLPAVDPGWLEEYHVSERINDLGVMIDMELAEAIVALKPRIDADLLADLDEATGGTVKLRGPSLLKWLQQELPADLRGALTVDRKVRENYGFRTRKKISADKVARRQVLLAIDERPDLQHVAHALTAFEEANKAAIAKFGAAVKRANDGILRGQFVFHGAGQTGRFSSTGVQVHNLKREVDPRALAMIAAIKEYFMAPGVIAQTFGMTISAVCSQVIRPLFITEDGLVLIWGDWSSVEARMLPWLSGYRQAEAVLDVFRAGKDIYREQAALILHKGPDVITKDERQAYGKVPVLSLGYQGGAGAFLSMAAAYGVSMSADEADQIKNAWRAANPWAPAFWEDLQNAAMRACAEPTVLHAVGRVAYQFLPGLLGGTLLCWLPSGAWIAYPEAQVRDIPWHGDEKDLRPALTFMHPTYGPSATYGGALAENITQGECATLLRHALVRCEREHLSVVLHVHDEIVIEADERDAEAQAVKLKQIMTDVPAWAGGLPLDADVEMGHRYKIKRIG